MKRLVKIIPVLLALFVCACGQSSQSTSTETVTRAVETKESFLHSPYDPSEFKEMEYSVVASLLAAEGFNNVVTLPVDDIDSKSCIKDGAVESVTINGTEDYNASTDFEKDAEVKITYHNIPKITIPISEADASSRHYMDVGKLFFDEGFKNVETDELYDLSAGSSGKTVITATGKSLAGETELPFDRELSIIGHYPTSEYPVIVTIDFKSNILLNKYDVIARLDGTELGKMEHGKGQTYNVSLLPGNHSLVFSSAKDSGVTGTAEFNVNSVTNVTYQINCEGKEVVVKETLFEQALKANQVLMPFSSYHYLRKDYQKVVDELKAQGFSACLMASHLPSCKAAAYSCSITFKVRHQQFTDAAN